MVAHRKQGPVLPTLVITINDKERKRRSSRAAGLISSKEANASTLWFRTPPDDHHVSLNDWARFILARRVPVSPGSPASPSFVNPFASSRSQGSDYFHRPSSGNANSRSAALLHKTSAAHSGRDRPITFSSESPSLRSKRSDVSSPSSTTHTHPSSAGFVMPDLNNYTTVLPTDIPSPVGTGEDYQPGEFIEGWTSAQGRSSTISSPVRGRGSISSQAQHPTASESSSPPQRETILDRAFQLRCIPGSENEIPGEDKLSSLARFDALMREADEKQREQHKRAEAERAAERSAMQSTWDLDDDSSEDEDGDAEEEDDDDVDDDDDSDDFAHEADNEQRHTLIPPSARRALDFLSSRHEEAPRQTPQPSAARNTASSHGPLQPPSRPHTAHSKFRPSATHRAYSQPQLVPVPQEKLDAQTPSPGKTSENGSSRPSGEKRASASSAKRLSFTEFTKRLSSTSSLLLVQTNASGENSQENTELDQSPSPVPKGTSNAKSGPAPPRRRRDRDREDWEKRCSWRAGFI